MAAIRRPLTNVPFELRLSSRRRWRPWRTSTAWARDTRYSSSRIVRLGSATDVGDVAVESQDAGVSSAVLQREVVTARREAGARSSGARCWWSSSGRPSSTTLGVVRSSAAVSSPGVEGGANGPYGAGAERTWVRVWVVMSCSQPAVCESEVNVPLRDARRAGSYDPRADAQLERRDPACTAGAATSSRCCSSTRAGRSGRGAIAGAWSIPKGEYGPTRIRWRRRAGSSTKSSASSRRVDPRRTSARSGRRAGKLVRAWAIAGDLDAERDHQQHVRARVAAAFRAVRSRCPR